MIADLHSLTQRYSVSADQASQQGLTEEDPKEQTFNTAATLLGCGVDKKKSTLFVQSRVTEHTSLHWLLSCMIPAAWLNRMVQFKEKS